MDMDLMVMEREMLSPVMDTELVTVLPLLLTIHMVAPALPTEAPRVFLDKHTHTHTHTHKTTPCTHMHTHTPC